MTSKEALEKLFGSYVSSKCYGINYKQDDEDYEIIKKDLERLEQLELELHYKNNSIKTLEAFHKSKIENYLRKENKLLDELCKALTERDKIRFRFLHEFLILPIKTE